MAPIKDETVDTLKELVNKLEARVKQLEEKIQHGGSGAAPAAESIRMILMGPPGAGMPCSRFQDFACESRRPPANYLCTGKGTQAPKIKEKFSCCHLVRLYQLFL
jgi:adenylate kinase